MTDILPLEAFLPYRLVRVSNAVSQRFAAAYKMRFGLTRPEWRSIAILGEVGEATATEIGRRSTMHKTKVSRAVAALEARGWLTRRADSEDRRLEHLELTAKGRHAYRELVQLARRFQEDLVREMGAEAAAALDQGLAAAERMPPARRR